MSGIAWKRVFPKFEAERSHPAIIRGRRMMSPTAVPIIRRLRFSLVTTTTKEPDRQSLNLKSLILTLDLKAAAAAMPQATTTKKSIES